jgi:ABC-type polar amino acid transport system ATPase subunit
MAKDSLVLEIHELVKTYHMGEVEVHALKGINLAVERGEFVAIMGPSGSGKSTLMNIVGCLDRPTSGSYRLDGIDVSRLDRDARAEIRNAKIGFVFQGFNLLARTRATENVELPLLYSNLGLSTLERARRAREALRRVGLGGREDHYPSQLSGGQQQRVAIARALAMEPKLMLFDEPTSALDPELVGDVLDVMRDLVRDGMTMIVVTHEIGFAREVGDSLVFMDGGVVVEAGRPREVIENPREPRTREFLGKVL